jgi:hypothetical protein
VNLLLDRRRFLAMLAAGTAGACTSTGDADPPGASNDGATEDAAVPPSDSGPATDAGQEPTMDTRGIYLVTDHGAVADDPSNDLADAFDRIFELLDARGPDEGRGGAIFIPPGTFYLKRAVRIRHSFLTIAGFNAGFETGTGNGGGTRVVVQGDVGFFAPLVAGEGRISSVEFADFMLDGEVAGEGRKGIFFERDNDSIQIRRMAMKELGDALTLRAADACIIEGNMILENLSCLRLVEAGIASVVSHNRLGAKPPGITAFIERHDRAVFQGNNVFPDGYANLVMKGCTRCTVNGNQFQSFYAPVIFMEGGSHLNSIVGNTIQSRPHPDGGWNQNPVRPFPDDFGVVRIEGDDNIFAHTTIDTHGPADAPVVRVTGVRNQLSGLRITGPNGPTRKVQLDAGVGADANAVLWCGDAEEVAVTAGASVRLAALPEPT